MRGIKPKKYGNLKRVLVFVILLVIFLVLLNSVNNVYRKKQNAKEALLRMGNQILELKTRQKYLSNYIERLSTEEGIKLEVKRKLNVAQVGEKVAVIVEEEFDQKIPIKNSSYWDRFINYIYNLFR